MYYCCSSFQTEYTYKLEYLASRVRSSHNLSMNHVGDRRHVDAAPFKLDLSQSEIFNVSLSADAKVHVPPPGPSPEATGPPTAVPKAEITTTAAEITEIPAGKAEVSKGEAEFSKGEAEVVSPEKAEEDNGVRCVHVHDTGNLIYIYIHRCERTCIWGYTSHRHVHRYE